jgi:hypothetical protein
LDAALAGPCTEKDRPMNSTNYWNGKTTTQVMSALGTLIDRQALRDRIKALQGELTTLERVLAATDATALTKTALVAATVTTRWKERIPTKRFAPSDPHEARRNFQHFLDKVLSYVKMSKVPLRPIEIHKILIKHHYQFNNPNVAVQLQRIHRALALCRRQGAVKTKRMETGIGILYRYVKPYVAPRVAIGRPPTRKALPPKVNGKAAPEAPTT